MKINSNFEKLVPNYLFADVARKTNEFAKANPDKEIIRLGIGDVTLPLSPVVVNAMKKGCDDFLNKETFKGYPEYEGYDFVRQAVSDYYKSFGVKVDYSEVFISDGAKSDCGNIGDIFSKDNIVLVPDPVYPVYVDANIMSGRNIIYASSSKEDHFLAMPDKNVKADIIYICSPNNPTGAAYNAEQLKEWVNYAIANNAVILYDAAYEAFVQDDLPRSIFEIDGARECAIELCSLSKTAGFTGVRCGYTVIPKELERGGHKLHDMWYRRQSTKFNGVSWAVQCGAAAVFSEEGQKQCLENIRRLEPVSGLRPLSGVLLLLCRQISVELHALFFGCAFGYVVRVRRQAHPLIRHLMLEVVSVHFAVVHDEPDDLRRCVRNLDGVCFDVGHSKPALLHLVFQVHHEQSAALGHNVVRVARILERINKAGAR